MAVSPINGSPHPHDAPVIRATIATRCAQQYLKNQPDTMTGVNAMSSPAPPSPPIPKKGVSYETLHRAAWCGDSASFYDLNKTQLNDLDSDGRHLLHAAIDSDAAHVVAILLTYKPELETLYRSFTPIFYTAVCGATDSFDQLLQTYRDKPPSSLRTEESENFLHVAIRYGQNDFIVHLRENHPALFDTLSKQRNNARQTPQTYAADLEDDAALTALLGAKHKARFSHAPSPKRPQVVIFEQGIGARAFAHVGAYQALEEKGLSEGVQEYCGISWGAIIAALAALRASSREMLHYLITYAPETFLDSAGDVFSVTLLDLFAQFNEKKVRTHPHHQIESLTALPYALCQGKILERAIASMIEDQTGKTDVTLGDLATDKRWADLTIPLRNKTGELVVISSTNPDHHDLLLAHIVSASCATAGLYPRKSLFKRDESCGQQVVHGAFVNCSDAALLLANPSNLYGESHRRLLSFALRSSPPTMANTDDLTLERAAHQLVSIHLSCNQALHQSNPGENERRIPIVIDQGNMEALVKDPSWFVEQGKKPVKCFLTNTSKKICSNWYPPTFTPVKRPNLMIGIDERALLSKDDNWREQLRAWSCAALPALVKQLSSINLSNVTLTLLNGSILLTIKIHKPFALATAML